jgi:branched-chain amino acid transport system ATP-binding protein
MGWVPEDRRVFAHLTVAENLRVAAHAAADPDARLGEAYDLFPALERFADKEAGDLSGGQQQMLAIARGMLGDNDLLLVDEPSEGLAPQIVSDVVEALRAASADTTMVLVEQNFRLAMDLADRFYLVDHGVVVEEGDTEGVTSDDERVRRYLTA